MPASYLLLEVRVLILSELDAPLPMERPFLDGLKMLLVLDTLGTSDSQTPWGRWSFPHGRPSWTSLWRASSEPYHMHIRGNFTTRLSPSRASLTCGAGCGMMIC